MLVVEFKSHREVIELRKYFVKRVVFPLMEKVKGNRIRHYLRELQDSERYDADQIRSLQMEKLQRLLIHCLKNVPAYKELAGLLTTVERDPHRALEGFPVLTKSHFVRHADRYLSDNSDKSELIANRTGGSTGEPVHFYLDRVTVEYYEAARWRGLSWWGIELSDPSVMIWGAPLELSKNQSLIYRLKERFLKNRIIIPAYGLDPRQISHYVRLIESFAPEYLYGYASALSAFASLLGEHKLRIKRPLKGVVSTAETLFDEQRAVIERYLGGPVINEYGARDGGIIAFQCPSGSMHISEENLILEIIDMQRGKRVEDGRSGLVAVTDLNNYSMPRIRYLLGDVASLSPERCPCGRSLRTLKRIEGRVDDLFLSLDGKIVHGHYWNHIARNMKGIRQFQLIQHDPENVTLKVVKSELFDSSEVKQFLEKIEDVLGPVRVNLIYCDSIEPSPSGKIRYAIREFPLPSRR
ncbi:MAG: hypothetical protein PWP44_38 [Thermacetogenium sp.]|uniref:Acetyl-CoA ligase-like protein n=1 Tax=Thermacetogenium phaeum TaxID=85874 RepID=A0A101FHN1_9THEO|nr:MAG: Acetyl-CoA ligase-like protein [Thermacetogenium phaeum]MDN5364835.1 hypothetical protein [Thermacetogenium sp.]MDN5375244.1 hypothetical protein [Thermacetogenium sp.]